VQTTWTVEHLFAASHTKPLGRYQNPSGIWKTSVEWVTVNKLGIVGDIQADRRYHGGVEKALHQYAVENYALLAKHYPQLADQWIAGSLGENLSALGMTEQTVYIGDIFRVGGITIQVSEPREPCSKINSKFADKTLVKFIAKHYIYGWYYRVLEEGRVQVGDSITLLERPNLVSMQAFLQTINAEQPSLEAVEKLAACEGVSQQWQKQVLKMLDALR